MTKMRVHELAKELRITSRMTLERLHQLGEPVRSPSSMVDAAVADDLRAASSRDRWDGEPQGANPAESLSDEPSVKQRLEADPGIIQRIMRLRETGTKSDADELAVEANIALQDESQKLSVSERHFLTSFVNDPYLRLPRGRQSRTLSSLDQRDPLPSASSLPSRAAQQGPKKALRPRENTNKSQALHKIAERNARETLRPRASDGQRQRPPQQLKQLLQDVEKAELSQDRAYRRETLRQVSFYLYYLPGVQPDTPGIKKLRSFRDHPFRGIYEDNAPTKDREVVEVVEVDRFSSPSGPTAAREPSIAKHRHVPTPAEVAPQMAPRLGTGPGNVPAANKESGPPRQEDLAQSKTYQTFFNFDAKKFDTVKAVINEWLTRKEITIFLGETSTQSTEGRVAKSLTTSTGPVAYHRLRMVEEQPQQNFHTEIILGEHPEQAWLWVNIWSDGKRPANPPRFMRSLFEDAGPLGSLGVLGPTFTVIEDESEALQLRDYLTDPTRQLPVFVAGTDRVPQDDEFEQQFRASARRWAQDTMGLAAFVVLGPQATERLEEELGDSFAPRRWTIRTYEPHLKLEDRHDARRHRFFSTERLAQWEPIAVSRRLGTVARAISHQRTTPPQLRNAQLAFTQEENTQLLGELRSGNRKDSFRVEADRLPNSLYEVKNTELYNIQLLKELLETPVLSEDAVVDIAQHFKESSPMDFRQIEDRLKELTTDNQELRDHRDSALEEAASNFQHLALVENDIQRLRQKMKWLQSELAERGAPEAAYAGVQVIPEESPSNFEELLDEFSVFEDSGVEFTGSRSTTLALDDIDTQGHAVHAAWMSLHTLADYLRACKFEAFQGNVHMYLSKPPSLDYTIVSSTNHAARESDTTMSQFGHQRIFKVPDSVSESGRTVMQAHFKLHRIGIQSPRLHYLDRSSIEGKIYVGYIGPHLETPATN